MKSDAFLAFLDYFCGGGAPTEHCAVFTLFDGQEYRQMHLARAQRVKQASSAGAKSLAVEFIPRNELLLFEDLKPEETNLDYAKFHGLHSVTVIE